MSEAKDYDRELIETFRTTRDITGVALDGRAIVLITTKGARSGQLRTTPLVYTPDSDRLLVVASNAGKESHPAWYYNLKANPEVTVEVGAETYQAIASEVMGTEREALWARVIALNPFFGDYQTKISRLIPLIALTRKEA